MKIRNVRPRSPSRFAGTAAALVATAFAPSAFAEPLSLVQTLSTEELGGRVRETVRMEAGPESLYLANRGGDDAFSVFDRDPVTGMLQTRYFIGTTDASGAEPVLRAGRVGDFAFGPDGLLFVEGSYFPPGCDSVNCDESGALVFRNADGPTPEFIDVDEDVAFARPYVAPDGNHLYARSSGQGASLDVYAIDRQGDLAFVERAYRVAGEDNSDGVREVVFVDDRRLLVLLSSNTGTRVTLAVVNRDPATGRLSRGSAYAVPPEAGRLREIVLSADRSRIYASAPNTRVDPVEREGSGLASFTLDEDGTIGFVGLDATANERAPGSLAVPSALALANDRLLLVGNDTRGTNAESLHLWTLAEDGTPVYRGREQEGSDGVASDVLDTVRQLAVSPDGAYAYAASDGSDSLSVFALHADLGAEIDAVGSRGDTVSRSRVRVVNDGPAAAHEVVARIEADAPIVDLEVDAPCTIEGNVATCTIDELLARGLADVVVSTATGDGEDVTLDVEVDALQTDLDTGGNDAAATVALQVGELPPAGAQDDPSDAGPTPPDDTGVDPEEADPVAAADDDADGDGGAGASSGDDDGSGGGCTIGTGAKDPSTALLALLAGLGLVARARRRGAAARDPAAPDTAPRAV